MGLWDLIRSKHMKTVLSSIVANSQLYFIVFHIFSESVIFFDLGALPYSCLAHTAPSAGSFPLPHQKTQGREQGHVLCWMTFFSFYGVLTQTKMGSCLSRTTMLNKSGKVFCMATIEGIWLLSCKLASWFENVWLKWYVSMWSQTADLVLESSSCCCTYSGVYEKCLQE